MEEKAIHFKLDFKYKFENENYGIDDLTNTGYHSSLRNSIYKYYKVTNKQEEFWSFVTAEEVQNHKVKHYDYDSIDPAAKQQIVEDFYSAIKDPTFDGYYGTRSYNHSMRYLFNDMQNLAAERTPEYKNAREQFDSWLKTRPGLVRIYCEYRDAQNQKRAERNKLYTEEHSYHEKLISDSMEIENIGSHLMSTSFRRALENARPQRYPQGSVVRLRSTYLNKRGKDPFFYTYDRNLKDQERVGTVLKKIKTNRNYGQGSREIRVMWFANGEESLLMERCLEKYEPDAIPAATKV